MNTTIGTIHVPAGTARQTFETAAWYRTFEYDAQTVEVRLAGNFATYTLVGRYTYEYLPSLLGGVATGGGPVGEIDEAGTYTVQFYSYEAAAMVEAGDIVLHDGFEVRESFHDHPISCQGYGTDWSATGLDRYPACEHEAHENVHGALVTERNDRGHLPFGYVPGVKDRKRHVKVVAA